MKKPKIKSKGFWAPASHMWHRDPKPITCRFWLFCWIIFYIASASKYFLQNQNISFLTEVILVWLEQSKKWKDRIKCLRFSCYRNALQSSLHYSVIIPGNKGLHSVSNKTNSIKIGLKLFKIWEIHGHQLNWRIANSKTPLSYSCLYLRK